MYLLSKLVSLPSFLEQHFFFPASPVVPYLEKGELGAEL
jgi:hypothetical protein